MVDKIREMENKKRCVGNSGMRMRRLSKSMEQYTPLHIIKVDCFYRCNDCDYVGKCKTYLQRHRDREINPLKKVDAFSPNCIPTFQFASRQIKVSALFFWFPTTSVSDPYHFDADPTNFFLPNFFCIRFKTHNDVFLL